MAIQRYHVSYLFGVAALALVASGWPALAHHAMGGELPRTFAQGFISGIGHPLIGIDHFAFVVAAGITAALAGRIWGLALAFVAGTFAGCLIHLGGITLPMAEIVTAGTVLLIGSILVSNRVFAPLVLVALFVVAGLFHGWAYGESIFGAKQAPLVAYLAGFSIVQFAVAGIAGLVGERLVSGDSVSRVNVRLAGAVVAGIGLAYSWDMSKAWCFRARINGRL